MPQIGFSCMSISLVLYSNDFNGFEALKFLECFLNQEFSYSHNAFLKTHQPTHPVLWNRKYSAI